METAGIESLQRIKGYRLEPNTYCLDSAVVKMLNRNSVGIEKEGKYLKIIEKRLSPPQKRIGEENII